jgi:hypothetical protein
LKEDAMTYDAPALLDLGPVEERTFGGELLQTRWDFITGYTGWRQDYPPNPDVQGAE